MAGKPLKRQMFATLDALSKESGLTPAEYVHDFIANGGTMTALAEKLGMKRPYASRELNAHPEIRKALDAAKVLSAEAIIEDASTMADELAAKLDNGEEVRNERIAVLREQIGIRKFRAAANNPERFGKQNSNITINLGDLHLDALRKTRSNVIDVTPSGTSDDE